MEIVEEERFKVKIMEEKLAEQDRIFKQRGEVLRKSFEALIVQLEREKDKRDDVLLNLLSGKEKVGDEHALELAMVRMDAKANTALEVLLAKVETAEEDPVNWNIEGWKDSIFQMTGIHPDSKIGGEYPAEMNSSEEVGATSKEV